MDAFRHYQISDGEIPFCFGMRTSMRDPQFMSAPLKFRPVCADGASPFPLGPGSKDQLMHFYYSAKRGIRYQYSLDNDNSGIRRQETTAGGAPGGGTVAGVGRRGVSSDVAGNWLATLQAGKALNKSPAIGNFPWSVHKGLPRPNRLSSRGYGMAPTTTFGTTRTLEEAMRRLANQLLGEWCSRVAGLGGVLPAGHVAKALRRSRD